MNRIVVIAAAVAIVTGVAPSGSSQEAEIRPPAVAGAFYSADARELESTVRGFLATAVAPKGERPIALVTPHAGYLFSGQVAADAFRQAAGYPTDVVVILGTAHTVPQWNGVSVYQGAGYRTPLGTAQIDQELAAALARADRRFAFRPAAHSSEHSEEVEIPFVQVLFPRAKIVTAIVGSSDPELTRTFGQALARVLKKRNALIVASSDLSHYPAYGDAVETDRATLNAITSLDPSALLSSDAKEMRTGKANLVTCACGEAPILAAMHAARALGARRGTLIRYANSGDSPVGDRSRVVGYGAVMFTAGRAAAAPIASGPGLTEAERAQLLQIARQTLERTVSGAAPAAPAVDRPALLRKQGAFVTLNERGQLRGCIGNLVSETPLATTIARMTVEAATGDPRFPPVRRDEVPAIDIEISVLTPLSRIDAPDAIRIGRDGVYLEKGGRSAVFLPQVAPEQHWNRDQLLENLCQKGGLDRDCWRSDATLYTFQAEVFGEKTRR